MLRKKNRATIDIFRKKLLKKNFKKENKSIMKKIFSIFSILSVGMFYSQGWKTEDQYIQKFAKYAVEGKNTIFRLLLHWHKGF
jgi:hypothetical protein